jgi:iron complex outermembrane receptor protein
MGSVKPRAWLAGGVALAVLAAATGANAQQHTFNVPSEEAVKSIPSFARQADLQIVAPADQLVGVKTPALHGSMDARAALRRLIAGTGLEIATDSGDTITLRHVAAGVYGAAAVSEARTQDSPSGAPAPPPGSNAETGQNTSRQGTVQEVVVTARRRAEPLQKVPINVSAFNAEQLSRALIQRTDDLTKVTPGLNFFNGGVGTATIFIRGVGKGNTIAGAEASVPFYVDDVYYAGGPGLLASLDNVQQVEVLKGPQGTLFGRNATGGLISVTTQVPSATPRVDVKVGYESYNTTDDSLYVTGPLTNNLFGSISAHMHYQADGYGKNLELNETHNYIRYYNFRGRLLWTPTSSDYVNLAADYYKDTSDFGNNLGILPGTLSATGGTASSNPFDVTLPRKPNPSASSYGGSLRWEHDFDNNLVFKSITAYRQAFYENLNLPEVPGPIDFGVVNAVEENWSFQQEFLLQGKMGPLNYTAGLFYITTVNKQPLTVSIPAFDIFESIPSTTGLNSYAAFAQVDYRFTDRDTLTLGGRYTTDHQRITAQMLVVGAPPVGPFAGHHAFDDFTWHAALKHEFTNKVMAYVSASKGYNSGVYNSGGAIGPKVDPSGNPILDMNGNPIPILNPPVRPEILYAYEGGLKSTLFNDHLQLNADAFYYDYSNLQVQGFTPAVTVLSNAAKAQIYGGEISAVAKVPVAAGELELRADASFLEDKYVKYPGCTIDSPFASPPAPPGTVVPGSNENPNGDCSGKQLPNTPRFTFSFSPYYTIPIQQFGGTLALSMTYYHSSGFWYDPFNVEKQGPYDTLDADIAYSFPDGRTRLRFYAANLTNAVVRTSVNESQVGFFVQALNPPRVFGVQVEYNW